MTEANIALVPWQQSWVSSLPPSYKGRAVVRVGATQGQVKESEYRESRKE